MKPLILFSSLLLTVGYLLPVHAVTDAELEALEKKIEQQETEDKQKIETEKKKKKEAEAKSKEEQKRKVEAETQRKSEEKEKRKAEAEAERKAEEARLAEIEQQRQEVEEKKRIKEEKYIKHKYLAETYMEEDKFNLAIKEYELLLEFFPDDTQSIDGLKEAQTLQHACNAIVGTWIVEPAGRKWVLNKDKTANGTWLIFHADGFWECLNAREREFRTSWPECTVCGTEYLILSDDGNTLMPSRNSGSTGRRVVKSSKDALLQKQSPLGL